MSIKNQFLSAPSDQIHPSLIPFIAEWDSRPTPLQILRVLDEGEKIRGIGQAVKAQLEITLRSSMLANGTDFARVCASAEWRKG